MSDVEIRAYDDADEPQVLDLLAASMGRSVDDRYRDLFRWKHLQNPFGRSFTWVGVTEGRIVGLRSFLRWRFLDEAGSPVEAVRAVDTATHPDAQGKGLFRTMTLHGLDEMRSRGIAFVFNTPNDQSRPGYLKMGWTIDGRVPVAVRPRSLASLVTMARARTAADAWSLATDLGQPLGSVLDHVDASPRLQPGRLVTDRSPEFVRWRYAGCPPVGSRAIPIGSGAALLVRLRTRGPAIECTVGDLLGSAPRRECSRVLRRTLEEAGADYAIASAQAPLGGMFRSSRLGPTQTRRQVGDEVHEQPLSLCLGDVELF